MRNCSRLEVDALSSAQKAKMSLFLIVIMSIAFGVLLAYGIDEWLRGNSIKSIVQGVLAVLLLGAALLHVRVVYGLVR